MSSTTRISKIIKDPKDIEMLRNLDEKDITTSFIMDNFGSFDNKRKFNPYDLVTIPPDSFGPEGKRNKNAFTTTIGIFVLNKYLFEHDFFDIIGYVNKNFNSDMYKEINKKLSSALIEDKITVESFKHYHNKIEKMMPYCSILSPHYTDKMLTCTKIIGKKKQELIKKYQKEIESGDAVAIDKMTKELLDFAVTYMGDDPSMDMYLSGARGDINNNFKNIFVMRGIIKDPDPNAKQKYHVSTSCFIDGIKPEEYALISNSLAAGPFARSRKTATGGYWEKLMVSALQHITLDPPGSDCGTKKTLTITFDKKNIESYVYSYVVGRNGSLIEITSENKDQFIGKTCKVRFSAFCESKTGICNKCMGTLFYRIGINNVGLSSYKIASILKNIAMKAFHDNNQKFSKIPLDKVFK